MAKLKRLTLLIILLIISALILLTPPPVAPKVSSNSLRLFILIAIFLLFSMFKLGSQIAAKFEMRSWKIFCFIFLAAAPLAALLFLSADQLLTIPAYLALLYFLLYPILWGIYSNRSTLIPASSLVALLLTLGSFSLFEVLLQSIDKSLLAKEIASPVALVAPDRAEIVYKRNGFRGRRPCTHCEPNLVRIVTMGGSSTFGVPMYYSGGTYSAILQRMLNLSRQGERYEVLNAGVAGFGMVQILDAIERDIAKIKPNFITINEWYNDATAQPGWYGIVGKSDLEAYISRKTLLWVEGLPGFKALYYSRSIGILRHYLLTAVRLTSFATASKEKKKRLNPEEYEWALEQIVALGNKYDFVPIFILEPLNRSLDSEAARRKYAYYRVMAEVAQRHNILLVDTLNEFSKRKAESLFYDFIHPNQEGHRIIAEGIYRTLFAAQQSKASSEMWQQLHVDVLKPQASNIYLLQYEAKQFSAKEFRFSVRAPYMQAHSKCNLQIRMGRNFKMLDKILDPDWQEYTFTPFFDSDRNALQEVQFGAKCQVGANPQDKLFELKALQPEPLRRYYE